MKKNWEVDIDGVKHNIQYKAGFGCKIIVDGEVHKVKSSNWFINLIDYAIKFGSTDLRLVAIGNKIDLAVNGVYLGSGENYEPVSKTPSWVYVLVGLSVIGGYFVSGLFGLLVGVLFSSLYVQSGLKKKTGVVIGAFAACTIIQIAILFLAVMVGATMA